MQCLTEPHPSVCLHVYWSACLFTCVVFELVWSLEVCCATGGHVPEALLWSVPQAMCRPARAPNTPTRQHTHTTMGSNSQRKPKRPFALSETSLYPFTLSSCPLLCPLSLSLLSLVLSLLLCLWWHFLAFILLLFQGFLSLLCFSLWPSSMALLGENVEAIQTKQSTANTSGKLATSGVRVICRFWGFGVGLSWGIIWFLCDWNSSAVDKHHAMLMSERWRFFLKGLSVRSDN